MKIFKILQGSIDFSINLLIFSLASGVKPPNPPKPNFQNFLELP